MHHAPTEILVLDDEDFNLDIIAEFLRDSGHPITGLTDSAEAWALLDADPDRFAAIILDRMMPPPDGMEMLRRIKADPRFEAMPVIMQTAATSPEEVAEGLAAGAWYYLAKPLSEQGLNRIVEAALGDRERRLELRRMTGELQQMLHLTVQARYRFRTLEEARLLAATLARLCPIPEMAAMGLSELTLNAVEHGNLGISYAEKGELLVRGDWEAEIERRLATPDLGARVAEIAVECLPDRVRFVVEDMGDGFDWQRYLDLDPARAFDSHGRGIALARQLSFPRIEYQGKGNRVLAEVTLPAAVPGQE